MKKKNLIITKKDIIANLTFIITFIIVYLILTKNTYIFASTIDFQYQHYLIPEYFRNLFYNTKEFFPDFALNLGGGQNIYYLSYYGLFNPYILLSYFFPKIQMIDYIITVNCLIILFTTTLFYFYLRKHHYNEKTSFITAFLLLTSGPLIYHAKRHIMFINYFPFLILGLYGIDNYFQKKSITLLTISLSLIILSSYYFSIPALIVLLLYSIYQLLQKTPQLTLKKIIKHIKKISIPFILSILITSFLTLPTFYTLLHGRTPTHIKISLKQLLTPSIRTFLLYNPYSIGLTSISIITLIYFTLKGKKETKLISIICLLISFFPIFNYILNGTLYINSKSLIPFSPIILLLVANFLSPHFKKSLSKKQTILLIYLIITSFSICLYTNQKDSLIKKESINNSNTNTINQLIKEITNLDKSFYRINNLALGKRAMNKVNNIKEYKTTIYSSTSNQNYINTYNNILNNPLPYRNKFMIAPSTNIFSQTILNEKYIITKESLNLKLIKEQNGIKLYQNNNTLPLGYATNNLINTNQFQTLKTPTNILTLLNSIIINNNTISDKKIKNIYPKNINYEIINKNNVEIIEYNQTQIIKAGKNASITIKLKENLTNKVLFLRFHHTYIPNQDLSITINNIQNKLTAQSWKYFNNNTTFNYTISNTNTLNIIFQQGTYKLNNFESYILDYHSIKNNTKNIDEFKINTIKTKGDTITGNIYVTNDNSYFTISIPYDKGFKVKVDNQNTKYEKSGTNFITFPIKKGHHNITITYQAPYKKISLLISLTGIILFIITIYYQNKKNTSLKGS